MSFFQRWLRAINSKTVLYAACLVICSVAGAGFFVYDLLRLVKYGLAAGPPFLTTLVCGWAGWVFWTLIKRLRRPSSSG